jgi:hypothetical protein
VPLGIVRGYSSESFCWEAAQAILGSPKPVVYVYQLGDHDPSGVDAWRAFRERVVSFLGMYVTEEMARRSGGSLKAGATLGVAHLETFYCGCGDECQDGCGPACACRRDGGWARSFGGESVEVDAIPPTVLRQIVEDAITRRIDPGALEVTRAAEQSEREVLTRMIGGNS